MIASRAGWTPAFTAQYHGEEQVMDRFRKFGVTDFGMQPPPPLPPSGMGTTRTWCRSSVSRSRSPRTTSSCRVRADVGECELIAKTRFLQEECGFLFVGRGQFKTDRQALPAVPDLALRALAQLGARR